MQLSTYQIMFLRELHIWGGVSVKFWMYASNYAGIGDKKVFDQAVARIQNTERFNPGNRITAEMLAEMPRSLN